MMYAMCRYLPHQSSDCFDIFISMSSIINHPGGEVRPMPSSRRGIRLQVEDKVIGRLATCLAFELQLFSRRSPSAPLKTSLQFIFKHRSGAEYHIHTIMQMELLIQTQPFATSSAFLSSVVFFIFYQGLRRNGSDGQ